MKVEKFKVLLYLKKSGLDKNGKAPIMGHITLNRTMAQFGCKLSCTPKLWNPRESRLDGKSKEAVEVNVKIDKLLLAINSAYESLVEHETDFDAKAIKDLFQCSADTQMTLLKQLDAIIAVIESAFNPVAVSRAGAKGMWQFMYNTARMYGLTINSFVDERLDPVKSADAAARYMRDAYRIFGDWNLAVSAYNCGPGNVNKAIRRSGSRNYWDIYRYLPRETRGYVPAFVGSMYAMKYSKDYGLSAGPMMLPAQVDTFEISRNLHFQQISDLTGVSIDELRGLNPQYVKDIIPGDSKTYILRMPFQYTSSFLANEDSVYTYKADVYLQPKTITENSSSRSSASGSSSSERIRYKVRKGDTLGEIAMKYHVTVAQLKNWNHLRSSMISIGQTIYIYTKAPASGSKSSASGSARSGGSAPTEYVIRSGDTLSGIASRYPGVSAKDIMVYNGIGERIRVGQKILIPSAK